MTNSNPRRAPKTGLVVLFALLAPGLAFYYAGMGFGWALRLSILSSLVHAAFLALPDRILDWKSAMVVAVSGALVLAAALLVWALRVAKRIDQATVDRRRYVPFIAATLGFSLLVGLVEEFGSVRAAKNYNVPTASMEPTIQVGDRVRGTLYGTPVMPASGEIVVFKYPPDPDVLYVKRVAGVGGDTVTLEGKSYEVPSGKFFVVGDDPGNSVDSRVYGAVPVDHLVAKVQGVVYSYAPGNGMRWHRLLIDLK